ncbi:MAG TPA: HEAT repeat domain-containing protein, partial [Candidatus Bathyarchaeia archaeon]|nr:HEAT repeat domain-containing protein [Candidatus Bathyarchaeia archaeon]
MAEEPTKKGIEIFDEGHTAQELQAVKAVIALFLMAAKNYAIYPENHVTYQESLQTLMSRLDAFIENYGDLRFDVEKGRLLFQGETVHQDDPKKERLAFSLFRDGIQWLEFQEGLELSEISGLFKILNQYGRLQEEAEGDLVTAMWEMDFPHLQYAATDALWKAGTAEDFSTFKVMADEKQATVEHEVEPAELHGTAMQEAVDDDQQGLANTAGGQNAGVEMVLSTMDRTIWQLTQEELQKLKEMVDEEESQSNTEDILDILALTLQAQNKPEDYSMILEFMKEEFKNTLAQGEFRSALDFLESLQKTCQSCKIEKPWAQPLLGQFFVNISDAQVIGVLDQILPTLDKHHTDRIKVFRQLLLHFPPVAITALAPMLLEKLSEPVERQLMEIIGSLALRDIHPLKQLLDRPEEALVKKLVYILGHIKGKKTKQILLKMTRHTSGRVRLEALKALTRRDAKMIKELFPLVDDPVLTIRRLMWTYLEQHKDEEIGDLILNCLDQKKIRRRDDQQILNCYKTLGRCSSRSYIPFLRKSLFGQGWDFSSDRSLRRQGAAFALFELHTEEAQEILK